ncbi:uncharacterized protein LOC134839490 isoform X2 [Symsagittifera roscoffensis]|uniref:uncharacterized protein LOC134839490 isoform X2 n=1 Tax=Symsagittifera roscoffensis TaxID=84072 RepID=UPI00307C0239
MKPKFEEQFWAHKMHSVKAKIEEEDYWIPIMRDLETACRDSQFRKDFCRGGEFEVFQAVFGHVEKSVMGEVRMIGQFNKELKKELFEKTRINSKLNKLALPSITALWSLTSDTFTMDYKALLKEHIIEYILSWLGPLYCNEQFLSEDIRQKMFGGCLSIIWNSLSSDPDMKFPIRKHMAPHIEIIKSMSEDFQFDQRILALTCLLLLTDHERKSDFTTTSADLNILVQALHETIKSKGANVVISNATYKLQELLVVFLNVSENDTTKDILIDLQVSEALLTLLDIHTLHRDQKIQILQLLHKLSFKVKARSDLSNFVRHSLDDYQRKSNDYEITELCKRINFELEEKKRLHDSAVKPPEEKYKTPKHVLISYNWSSQPLALKLKSTLKANGIRTWMDVENMGSEILSSMAEAVENSFCVLVCVTEKYKESSACRSEAEYSYNLKRDIVPLMMEKGYTPSGWLGILCGTKKYYKWFNEATVESSSGGLVSYLLNHPSLQQSDTDVLEDFIEASVSSIANSAPNGISVDTKAVFLDKLENSSLQNIAKHFSEFDEEMIFYLQEMERRSPDFLWSTLETQYGMTFQQIVKFCVILKGIASS